MKPSMLLLLTILTTIQTLLALHGRGHTIFVRAQPGAGKKEGAAADVGFSAGQLRAVVGRERQADCELMHSFPEGDFQLGENIYWGSGTTWTPMDAVSAWADEEKYYTYSSNSCAEGQQCGHYTQIVWKTTRKIGCARVVCDSGDVFMTCNYYPPGNYIGERPY
ncbi:UNVERIFIED_CONTAM: Pathogenesis-related protein PR-1 [Sesamum angustifolium]|uniref:Pathogenesis-related protein PR-1 n=1 Tax=Sesamum angustifolium TaxID=2727405 RepID=A0AAW2KPH2_9LAMI